MNRWQTFDPAWAFRTKYRPPRRVCMCMPRGGPAVSCEDGPDCPVPGCSPGSSSPAAGRWTRLRRRRTAVDVSRSRAFSREIPRGWCGGVSPSPQTPRRASRLKSLVRRQAAFQGFLHPAGWAGRKAAGQDGKLLTGWCRSCVVLLRTTYYFRIRGAHTTRHDVFPSSHTSDNRQRLNRLTCSHLFVGWRVVSLSPWLGLWNS